MITAIVKLPLVERALNTLRKPDLRPAFRLARVPMREDLKDHQQKRTGEHGAWAPRAAATKARAGRYGRARREMGRAATAMASKVTRHALMLSSRIPFSETLRTGGTVGRGAKLPPRDLWWASPEALMLVAVLIQARLEDVFKRGA